MFSHKTMRTNGEIYKYRWVLLVCTSAVSFVTWGVLYCVGIYYVRWIDYFHATKGEVAIVGGLSSGTTCALGPVYGLCIHRFGIRKVGMAGGLLMAFGTIASAFASSLVWIGIFYGIVAGAGAGFAYLAASVALNQYFIKERPFAEGIMAMGTGVGTFVMNIFNNHLVTIYDWRGALIIMGALTAHIIPLCQVMITPSYLQRFPVLRDWVSLEEAGREKDDDSLDEFKESDEKCAVIEPNNNDFEMKRFGDDYEIEISSDGSIVSERLSNDDMTTTTTTMIKGNGDHAREALLLFRNPVFLLLLLSDFLCWVFIYIPYVHLPERSRLEGMNSDTIAWIPSTIGISGIVGRPVMSALPNLLRVNVFYLYGIANILLGLITVLSPLLSTEAGLFAYAALFGFLSVCVPLGKASAADLLGTEAFTMVYGWMLLFEGLGIYLGSPLAGLIYDVTLSYDYSFYCMGIGLMISGLLVFLRNAAFQLEKKLQIKECRRRHSVGL